LAVDVAAAALADRIGDGVVLEVGGDLALCGPPPVDGWAVRIADTHRAGPEQPGTTVVLHDGALATSAPGVRRWGPPGARRHHIVDPRTGRPAPEVWRTVSVAAATCVDANIASTAAVVLGEEAPAWLADLGLPALLRATDGRTRTMGGWPSEDCAA
jgi:thiamine biosynthesis lipoprotein